MMLFFSLSRYISYIFVKSFLVIVLGLYTTILLFDFAEFQRQTVFKAISFITKLSMVFLRVPSLVEQAFPFLVLIGALFMFWRLNRSQELIIFRAMGISLWRLILPVSLTALFIGFLQLTIFNPLASTMLARYEQLEKKYFSSSRSNIAVESTGVWLSEHVEDRQIIYRASQVNLDTLEFLDLNIVVLSESDNLVKHIDAKAAHISRGYIQLTDGSETPVFKSPEIFKHKKLPTSLTRKKIERMKVTRNIYSFWTLPAYIALLDVSGLKSIKYRMYWHSLLANAVWPAAMVLLAAAFSCRPLRQGKTVILMLAGLSVGFLLYFFKDVMFAFGVSGRLPPFVAAWLPSLLTFMVGSALVFIQEDG